jgi:FKBP-type peptidyl-prolyl cis-trans isomerase (trigger factor)
VVPAERFGERLTRKAVKDQKLMITLQRIADTNGIEVEDHDVTERVERMASEYGMSPSALQQRLLQNGGLFRVRNYLLAELTLDYLLELNAKGES